MDTTATGRRPERRCGHLVIYTSTGCSRNLPSPGMQSVIKVSNISGLRFMYDHCLKHRGKNIDFDINNIIYLFFGTPFTLMMAKKLCSVTQLSCGHFFMMILMNDIRETIENGHYAQKPIIQIILDIQ